METDHVISLISTIRDKATKYLVGQMNAEGMADIVPAHGSVIVCLFGGIEMPMSEIAKQIHRDKSTVTTLVNKLVSLGYVEKIKSGEDSRVTLVKLTEEGSMLEPAFKLISQRLLGKAWSGFSNKEKDQLINLLTRLSNNF